MRPRVLVVSVVLMVCMLGMVQECNLEIAGCNAYCTGKFNFCPGLTPVEYCEYNKYGTCISYGCSGSSDPLSTRKCQELEDICCTEWTGLVYVNKCEHYCAGGCFCSTRRSTNWITVELKDCNGSC